MPFPRGRLNKGFSALPFLLLLLGAFQSEALALGDKSPIHFSALHQTCDRKTNRCVLEGQAAVSQTGETLTADYIALDLNARTVDARGNCVYITSLTIIYGDEMHFNLDTRTGSIVAGRVASDRFTLSGERINKLSDSRFQTHWGDYTTCRDCPQSWSFQAEDVDMQLEGYAYLSNVTSKVVDVPLFWVPYLIVPMKTKRQTGLLFPEISGSGNYGFAFVLPFFWAISRSADMTLGLGEYSLKGTRAEWEGRYAISQRSTGTANLDYTRDSTFPQAPDRWGLSIQQTQELGSNFEEKLRLNAVGDNTYPVVFPNDVVGNGEAFLPSTFSVSYASSDVSAYVATEAFRNLMDTNPDPTARLLEFDPRTVQAVPRIELTTNDKMLVGNAIAGGISIEATDFWRPAGPFDYDFSSVPFGTAPPANLPYRPGIDPLRRAARVSFTPTLYTSLRPFDVFSLVPSLQYRSYYYNFPTSGITDLYRGYAVFQTDLGTQLEKVIEYPDDPKVPRVKHLIRPSFTLSYIPPFTNTGDSSHPFSQQIAYAQSQNLSGYNFDDNDLIPDTSSPSNLNYFVPLGFSLAYGLTTQWIRRLGAVDSDNPSYQTTVEVTAGQAINFKDELHPFTRLYSTLDLNFDHLTSSTTYYYYPYLGTAPNVITSSLSYVFERGLHRQVLAFDRSISLSYSYSQIGTNTSIVNAGLNFSLSDFILPSASISYDFFQQQMAGANVNLQFQSPSQCWMFSTGVGYTAAMGYSWNFDLKLNLDGSGFAGGAS